MSRLPGTFFFTRTSPVASFLRICDGATSTAAGTEYRYRYRLYAKYVARDRLKVGRFIQDA